MIKSLVLAKKLMLMCVCYIFCVTSLAAPKAKNPFSKKDKDFPPIVKIPKDIILKGNEGGNGGNGDEQLAYNALNTSFQAVRAYYRDLVMDEAYILDLEPRKELNKKLRFLESYILKADSLKDRRFKVEKRRKSKITSKFILVATKDMKKIRRYNVQSKEWFCESLKFSYKLYSLKQKVSCDELYPYKRMKDKEYMVSKENLVKNCKADAYKSCQWKNSEFDSFEKRVLTGTKWDRGLNFYSCQTGGEKKEIINAKSLPEAYDQYILNAINACESFMPKVSNSDILVRAKFGKYHKNRPRCKLLDEKPEDQYLREFEFLRKALYDASVDNKNLLIYELGESKAEELLTLLALTPNQTKELKLSVEEEILIDGVNKDFQNVKLPTGEKTLKVRRDYLLNLSKAMHGFGLLLHEYLGFVEVEINQYLVSFKFKLLIETAVQKIMITDPDQLVADTFHEYSMCITKTPKKAKELEWRLLNSIDQNPNLRRNGACVANALINNAGHYRELCGGRKEPGAFVKMLQSQLSIIQQSTGDEFYDVNKFSSPGEACRTSAFMRSWYFNVLRPPCGMN